MFHVCKMDTYLFMSYYLCCIHLSAKEKQVESLIEIGHLMERKMNQTQIAAQKLVILQR